MSYLEQFLLITNNTLMRFCARDQNNGRNRDFQRKQNILHIMIMKGDYL